jgi:hypothetical protein
MAAPFRERCGETDGHRGWDFPPVFPHYTSKKTLKNRNKLEFDRSALRDCIVAIL